MSVAQSCLTLCDLMDCSPPGSSVHGILQARILEWLASPFSRGSSWPKDQTQSPVLQADSLPSETSGKEITMGTLYVHNQEGPSTRSCILNKEALLQDAWWCLCHLSGQRRKLPRPPPFKYHHRLGCTDGDRAKVMSHCDDAVLDKSLDFLKVIP